ncbi:MAG: hypothetical protein OCD76_17285 [Reichenbachiella sp.]
MSQCVSGKRMFDTSEEAETALIENHIHFNHSKGSGPKNFYECRDCGCYHFTSQGELNSVIIDKAEFIKSQQRSRSWEDKLR